VVRGLQRLEKTLRPENSHLARIAFLFDDALRHLGALPMPMKRPFSRNRQSGMTLNEMMVSLAIGTIILFAIVALIENVISVTNAAKTAMDIESVRFRIRSQLECVSTVAGLGGPCGAGVGANLLSANASGSATQVLVAADPGVTTYGSYDVKATCTAKPHVFRVQISKHNANLWQPLFNIDQVCP
jgi:prepilin-type N-terminal cleavage/methylation domain-containing protein